MPSLVYKIAIIFNSFGDENEFIKQNAKPFRKFRLQSKQCIFHNNIYQRQKSDIIKNNCRDRSHTAAFGPSTALTVHLTVIHYRIARLRYVLDCPLSNF